MQGDDSEGGKTTTVTVTSDDMDNTTYDNFSLDYNKPKLITNTDFVLLLRLLKSPSCAPSYTDGKED